MKIRLSPSQRAFIAGAFWGGLASAVGVTVGVTIVVLIHG